MRSIDRASDKFSGSLSADGSIKELSDKDRATLNALRGTANQDSQLTEVDLDVGKYMVKVSSPGPSSDALITGVPLGAMYQTLTMLSITMGIGSVAVMIGTGFLGSFRNSQNDEAPRACLRCGD